MRWRGYGLVSEVESGDGRPCPVVDGFDGDVHADSVCTARKDANNALGVVDGRTGVSGDGAHSCGAASDETGDDGAAHESQLVELGDLTAAHARFGAVEAYLRAGVELSEIGNVGDVILPNNDIRQEFDDGVVNYLKLSSCYVANERPFEIDGLADELTQFAIDAVAGSEEVPVTVGVAGGSSCSCLLYTSPSPRD